MADEHGEPIDYDGLPPQVVSPLEQLAIVTHESYLAFLNAGFKEKQAIAFTMKTLELSYYHEEYSYEELDLDEDE